MPYAPVLHVARHRRRGGLVQALVGLAERSREAGGNIKIKIYPGATHSFDAPTRKRQSNDANATATEDAVARALQFFARNVAGSARD